MNILNAFKNLFYFIDKVICIQNTCTFSVSRHINNLLEKNQEMIFLIFFPFSSFQKWSLNQYIEYRVVTYILCGEDPDVSSNHMLYPKALAYVTPRCFSSKYRGAKYS